jgi:hypothetical protein
MAELTLDQTNQNEFVRIVMTVIAGGGDMDQGVQLAWATMEERGMSAAALQDAWDASRREYRRYQKDDAVRAQWTAGESA